MMNSHDAPYPFPGSNPSADQPPLDLSSSALPHSDHPVVDLPPELMQVEQLLSHFNQLEAQLAQVREGIMHSHRLATLGTITSIVAHEYNNILTPIMSYAQLALAAPDDRELMKKAVEKALYGAERAAKISASLLGFAREADQQHVANLPQVIEDAVSCLARDPKRDGLDMTVDVPDINLAITPINLEQVLVNLFLNAKQAMRRTGGQLCITAHMQGSMVCIDVSDTGPGIPPEIQNRLFEPFVTQRHEQGPMSPGERKGTGLGLCLCRDLIRAAGGNISFTTAPAKGTTFHITLPLADNLFDLPAEK